MAHIVELIFTEELRGSGTETDPYRRNPQLWTKDGKFVAELDPVTKEKIFNPEHI